MTRQLVIFAIACALGAAIAVIVRTANHQPYAEPHLATPMAANGSETAPAAMAAAHLSADAPSADHPDSGMAHPAPPATPPVASRLATVNTICPGCGEPIDPTLPYADYKGHKIGFGCARCPPKFTADPVKFGEAALKNQLAE